MFPASRVPPHLPKGTKLELGRGAHLGTPSSANHTAAASQPTGRIAKAASWLHLSRMSPALHSPERPSHIHTPKPGFGGRVCDDHIYILHSITYYCVPSSSPDFLCSDSFHHEMFRPLFCRPAPFPLVLGCSRPLVMPKALRSSRKQPIHSFSWPPTQSAPPVNSPNITHFGSLVSSMRATNPANRIRLLRKVASMLSLPVLIGVSR